jgi:hypothetical protein
VSRFDGLLAESRRVEPVIGAARPRLPRSFTAEGVLGLDRSDDLVPAVEAAALMNVSLAEVVSLAGSGVLDARVRRDGLWVRPVVLSRLRVRDQRMPEQVEPDVHVGTDDEPSPAPEVAESFGRIGP